MNTVAWSFLLSSLKKACDADVYRSNSGLPTADGCVWVNGVISTLLDELSIYVTFAENILATVKALTVPARLGASAMRKNSEIEGELLSGGKHRSNLKITCTAVLALHGVSLESSFDVIDAPSKLTHN